jgi:zinc transport system substrate-binding protein
MDWVREILGDAAGNTELTMVIDNGVDLHSYQPTADDIVKISNCDMFIYVGGESDRWVEDALKNAVNGAL